MAISTKKPAETQYPAGFSFMSPPFPIYSFQNEMARGSGGNEDLRDKLIDVMYENEQLKAENSKLRETLDKAYDFMKQFVVDGKNLLEKFLENVGQVAEKVRDGFRR